MLRKIAKPVVVTIGLIVLLAIVIWLTSQPEIASFLNSAAIRLCIRSGGIACP